jgi:WhiB family redox-sensing transcriptional regulator
MTLPSAGAGRITNTRQRESQLPCRTGDPDLWFAEHPTFIEQAKALCRECPVRAECLAGALDRREVWGVWGGELLINGAIVAHKRGRGRPRKNAAA